MALFTSRLQQILNLRRQAPPPPPPRISPSMQRVLNVRQAPPPPPAPPSRINPPSRLQQTLNIRRQAPPPPPAPPPRISPSMQRVLNVRQAPPPPPRPAPPPLRTTNIMGRNILIPSTKPNIPTGDRTRTRTSVPSAQPSFRAAEKIRQDKTIENIQGFTTDMGNILKMTPDTTVRSNNKLFDPRQKALEFVTSMPGDALRSYGRSLTGEASPLETALNVTDFIPGVGVFGMGIKKVAKEGGEQLVRKGISKAGKRIAKESGERVAKELTGDEIRVEAGKKYRGFVKNVAKSESTDPLLREKVLQSKDATYTPITNKQTVREAKSLIRKDINGAKSRIFDVDKTPDAVDNTVGMLLVKRAQASKNFDEAVRIVERLAERGTKAGQSNQVFRLYNSLTPEGILRLSQSKLKRADKKLTPEVAGKLTKIAKELNRMPDGYPKQVKTAEMLKIIIDELPKNSLDRISLAQTMAMLLNPKTAIRNIIGNTVLNVAENAKDIPATGLDKFTSLFTGKRTKTLENFNQIPDQLKGFKTGLSRGVSEAIKGIDTKSLPTQFDLPTKGALFTGKKNPLTYLEKALNIELKAFDRAGYESAFAKRVREQAALQAKDLKGFQKQARVLALTKNPTEEMIESAHLEGLYKTFQNESNAAKALQTIKKGLNMVTGSPKFGLLGDGVLKFPRTPGNLLSVGLIDYSPLGFFKTIHQLTKPLVKQPFNQKEFVDSFGRAVVGTTGLTGAGAVLFKLGIITDSPSSDKDLRALERNVGLGAFKINVSALKRWVFSGFNKDAAKLQEGDTMVSYDWLQPLATSVSIGAKIGKNIGEGKNFSSNLLGTATESITAGAETLAEQPLLSGLKRLGQTGNLVEGAMESVKSLPASFIPTLLNQIAQIRDNTDREVYDPDVGKQILNTILKRIPGARETLRPKITPLGEEAEVYQNKTNSIFNVMFNPAFVTKYNPDNISKMVLDLYKETGEKGQFPRVLDKKQIVNGTSKQLSAEEYEKFSRLVGGRTKEEFEKARNDKSFSEMLDKNEQVKILQNILTDVAREGKVTLLGEEKTLKDEAMLLDKELSRLSGEEANTRVKKLAEENPELFDKLKEVVENRKLNYFEKHVKKLGVENKARANRIYKEVEKLKTEEEKYKFIDDLYDKGVVSNNVYDQLEEMMKNPSVQTQVINDPEVKKIADKVLTVVPETKKTSATQYVPSLVKGLREAGLKDNMEIAYALATTEGESDFKPAREGYFNTNEEAIDAVTDLYNRGVISVNYALPEANGHSYYGRGFIQLTWPDNYKKYGKMIGMGDDLYNNPDKALEPNIAVKLLIAYMKENGVFDTVKQGDLTEARRLVNGGSNGLSEVNEAYNRYLNALN